MIVHVVQIKELGIASDRTSVHFKANSAEQWLYDFAVEHWRRQDYGPIEAYDGPAVISRFFHNKCRYSYEVQLKELRGGPEELDPDIVELTPDEVRVTQYALGDVSYHNAGIELGMNEIRVMNLIRSTRIKLED